MDATGDRRARKSRRAVLAAMTELLRERPFDEITVQTVIDRADIGRATFYAHFGDKLEVVDAVAADAFAGVHEGIADEPIDETSGLPLLALFRHVAERAETLRAMLAAPAAEVFWTRSREALATSVEERLRALPPRFDLHRTVPPAVRAHFVAGAIEGTMRWWLEAGLPYPPERMASMVSELLVVNDARDARAG